MTKRNRSNDSETFEQAAAESSGDRAFDFTAPPESYEPFVKGIYHRLRRVALIAGDESQLPDGKIYSQAQVIEILGEDYEKALAADPKCCG